MICDVCKAECTAWRNIEDVVVKDGEHFRPLKVCLARCDVEATEKLAKEKARLQAQMQDVGARLARADKVIDDATEMRKALEKAEDALRAANERNVRMALEKSVALEHVRVLRELVEHMTDHLDGAVAAMASAGWDVEDFNVEIDAARAALAATAPTPEVTTSFAAALTEAREGPFGEALRAIPDDEFAKALRDCGDGDDKSPKGSE